MLIRLAGKDRTPSSVLIHFLPLATEKYPWLKVSRTYTPQPPSIQTVRESNLPILPIDTRKCQVQAEASDDQCNVVERIAADTHAKLETLVDDVLDSNPKSSRNAWSTSDTGSSTLFTEGTRHSHVFKLSPDELCRFLSTHNVLLAPSSLIGARGKYTETDDPHVFNALLAKHRSNRQDKPSFHKFYYT